MIWLKTALKQPTRELREYEPLHIPTYHMYVVDKYTHIYVDEQ